MNQIIAILKSILLLQVIAIIGLQMGATPVVPAQAESRETVIAPIPGLSAFDEPESYSPDTLWEKINGQAEFYLPAGFESLQSQLYTVAEHADAFIEVNIYNMGNPANAFSVFSLQQRENARSIDVTPMAYQTENAVYFVHGPYYIEIISMAPLGADMNMLNQLARQFVNDTPVQSTAINELSLFPRENQITGSAAMISKDAFGFDRLDQIFTVTYRLGQDQVIAYLSKRKSAADAEDLVSGLYAFFKDFGATDIKQNTSIIGARMIEIMGTYEFMFAIDNYFAGVREVPTPKQAEKLAQMLAESLQK